MKAPADYPILMIVLNEVEHDNRVLKCARFLQGLGYPVTIFGLSNDKDLDKPILKKIDGLRVRLFPNPRFVIKSAPIRAFNWDATINHLIATMWTYFDKAAPAILHTHDFNTLKLGRELLFQARSNGANIYWVHDFHEYVAGLTSIDDGIRKLGVIHQDESIRIPDQLITVSPHLSEALRRDYRLRAGPSVILNSNSIDSYNPTHRDTIRKRLGLRRAVPLAVYTGGVSRPRGVHTLVETLPLIPEMHVALVTNNFGDYVDSLKAFAESHGCSDRLHILPYVPPGEVPSFIQDVTVGVHPMVHFENAEVALPNKLFDYCLARVPCVVSDCKAMGDFVREWRIGEVFRAEDVEDLARALRKVFSQRSDYVERLSGESNFVKAVAWEAQCLRLKELYDRARVRIQDAENDDNWQWLKRTDVAAPAQFEAKELLSKHQPERSPLVMAEPPQEPYSAQMDCTGAFQRVDQLSLVGWASDLLNPARILTIEAFYRGEKIAETATGLAVEDGVQTPADTAGFRLPLPRYFLDGKARRVTLKVARTETVLKGTPTNISVSA